MIVAGSPALLDSLAEGLPPGVVLEFTTKGRSLLEREPDLATPARIIVAGLAGLGIPGMIRFDPEGDPESPREKLIAMFLVERPWREVLETERALDRELDSQLDGWHDRVLYMMMPRP